MKWVVFVVLMSSEGDLEKMFNGGPGWDALHKCREFVTASTPLILENIEQNGLLDNGNTLLGIGCYEKNLAHEELIIF